MAEAVIMPQVGQDVETAIILEWFKKEMEPVQKGEIIATVESDKASFDVEAYCSGFLLKILFEPGAEVQVLKPIAYIGEPGDKLPEELTSQVPHEARKTLPEDLSPQAGSVPISKDCKSSPSARRLARQEGIDLTKLKGTGPGGRVIKRDVVKHSEREAVKEAGEAIPFTPMRSRIARRLSLSKQTIPHFYLFSSIDMTETLIWRSLINQTSEIRISLTDIILAATARILVAHPRLNAHVSDETIILKKKVNIGLAVSLEDGLIVPVIPNASEKTLPEISREAREKIEAARSGKLLTNEMATFTISNLGMYSIDMFIPVINPPECGILAIGKTARSPAVYQGEIRIRDIMIVSLACDHRVVDGVQGARFLEALKRSLEDSSILKELL